MQGLLDSIKSMFMKDDGSVKWNSLIGIGIGAVAGGFILPELFVGLQGAALISAALGAGVGLMGSQAIEMAKNTMPKPSPAAAVTSAPNPPAEPHEPAVEPPAVTPPGKQPVTRTL